METITLKTGDREPVTVNPGTFEKMAASMDRPPIEELLRRDIQIGIVFLNDVEQQLLDIEAKLRSMAIKIGNDKLPTTLPSQAVIKVFMSRNAYKAVMKSLTQIGTTLGVYSASKRELVDQLKSASEGLFASDDFEIDEITGEIVFKGQGTEQEPEPEEE